MANLLRVIHEHQVNDDASVASTLSRVVAYVPEETPKETVYVGVGYISASVYQANALTLGWLGTMYVREAFRRQRLGKLMMSQLGFAPQWFCQAFTLGSLHLCRHAWPRALFFDDSLQAISFEQAETIVAPEVAGQQFVHVVTCYPLPRIPNFECELFQLYASTLKSAVFIEGEDCSEEQLHVLTHAVCACRDFWLEGQPLNADIRQLLRYSTTINPAPEFSDDIED